MTVYNTMQISFDITEEEEIDGKTYTTYFNKRERFVQYIPYMPVLLWDQVQNYGFKRQPDGTLKGIHQGEYFKGPWFVRYLVQLHAYYVLWATEKHINSQLFGTEDLEAQEEQRGNIPLHVFNEWLVEQQAQKNAADKAAGLDTTAGEANVKALKKLKRNNSVVEVKKIKRNQSLLTSSVSRATTPRRRRRSARRLSISAARRLRRRPSRSRRSSRRRRRPRPSERASRWRTRGGNGRVMAAEAPARASAARARRSAALACRRRLPTYSSSGTEDTGCSHESCVPLGLASRALWVCTLCL